MGPQGPQRFAGRIFSGYGRAAETACNTGAGFGRFEFHHAVAGAAVSREQGHRGGRSTLAVNAGRQRAAGIADPAGHGRPHPADGLREYGLSSAGPFRGKAKISGDPTGFRGSPQAPDPAVSDGKHSVRPGGRNPGAPSGLWLPEPFAAGGKGAAPVAGGPPGYIRACIYACDLGTDRASVRTGAGFTKLPDTVERNPQGRWTDGRNRAGRPARAVG